jgi:hypothetical protein
MEIEGASKFAKCELGLICFWVDATNDIDVQAMTTWILCLALNDFWTRSR